ncbi:MAG: hypothetical protein HS115_05635 [Spirochaetales bacterium]|nr:hypothetical protein [Spirochaetales bacterium]
MAFLTTFPLMAQPAGAEKKALDSHQKISYLELAHATRRAEVLQERNIADIQRLKILIANFGSKVSGSNEAFEKIKNTYKKATESYYRRDFGEARDRQVECLKQIEELYQGFVTVFKEDLSALLTECSLSLSDLEFTQSLEPGQNSAQLSERILRSQFRLRTAFQQASMAESNAGDRRYAMAIDHYRLGKLYAIGILKDLAQAPEKATEIETKYAVDLRDAYGRSATAEKK